MAVERYRLRGNGTNGRMTEGGRNDEKFSRERKFLECESIMHKTSDDLQLRADVFKQALRVNKRCDL